MQSVRDGTDAAPVLCHRKRMKAPRREAGFEPPTLQIVQTLQIVHILNSVAQLSLSFI
jgi:hypothetical protein